MPRPADRPIPWRLHLPLMALIPGAVALDQLARLSPAAVEDVYTRGIFQPVAQGSRHLTAWLPFSITEALIVAAILAVGVRAGRGVRALWREERGLADALSHLAAFAASAAGVFAFGFLALWGLGLHRIPLAERLHLEVGPSPVGELAALAGELAEEASALRDGLPEDDAGVLRHPLDSRAARAAAAEGYAPLARRLPDVAGAYAPPKAMVFSGVLAWMGIGGFYGPPTFEAQYNARTPDPSLLFVLCHELAHQRGVVPEDEANLVGYLACRAHPDAAWRYSATFSALRYVLGALFRADPDEARRLAGELGPAVRRDSAALDAYLDHYDGLIRALTGQAHDAALKVQGQAEGLRTYGRMVDLLLAERRARGEAGDQSAP